MPGKKRFNLERCALILVEAAFFGDVATAKKNGISIGTLANYRKRLNDGDEDAARLEKLMAGHKAVLVARWSDALIPTLLRAMEATNASVEAIRNDPVMLKNPEILKRLLGAVKLLSEAVMTERMLDARLSGADGKPAKEAGSISAEEDEGGEQSH